MKVIQKTAFFISAGTDQGCELGLEEQFLAGLGVHHYYESDGVFGELGGFF